MQLCTRLQTRLKYYLESREVGQSYDRLCELLVADKLKSLFPNNLHDFVRQRELGGWLAPQELAKNVDTYVADRNTGAGGGDQGAGWRRVEDRRPPTALLSLGELKDSRVIVELVEEVVAEQAVERVQVEDVVLEEMLVHLAPSAHSATDPVISGLSASVVKQLNQAPATIAEYESVVATYPSCRSRGC